MSSPSLKFSVIYIFGGPGSIDNTLLHVHKLIISEMFLCFSVSFSQDFSIIAKALKLCQLLVAIQFLHKDKSWQLAFWHLLIFSQTSIELSVCSWNFRDRQQKQCLFVISPFTFNPFHKPLQSTELGSTGIKREIKKMCFFRESVSPCFLFLQRKEN